MTWFETDVFTSISSFLMSFLLTLQILRIFLALKIDNANNTDDPEMEIAEKKTRAPHFSAQECHLLAELMGEHAEGWCMSRHKLDKHRFTESK